MSYSDRYGRREDREKPDCYGDIGTYDPTDRVCEECPFKGTCRQVVRRKESRARRDARDERNAREDREERRRNRNRNREEGPSRDPADYTERDEESLSFVGAVLVNGGLSAVGAGLKEVVYAVEQIERFPYEDPFAKAIKRGREKREKREKREED